MIAENALEMDWPLFFGITLVIFGFAALMTGHALASTWRPIYWVVVYGLLLGLADRFIIWSLFDGELLSLLGYLIDTASLLAIGLISYRITKVRKMVSQYPWLYEAEGPFFWRRRVSVDKGIEG